MEDEWADDPEGLDELRGLIDITDALDEASKGMQDEMLGGSPVCATSVRPVRT